MRKEGHTGLYAVPGNGDYDWIGYVSPENAPQMINPEQVIHTTKQQLFVLPNTCERINITSKTDENRASLR